MIQKILIAILLLSVAAQSLNRTLLLLDYTFNTRAFIEKCINRERPSMQCQGKCQMNKKAKEAEKDAREQTQKSSNVVIDLFFIARSISVDQVIATDPGHSPEQRTMGQPTDRSSRIFRPPLYS